MAPPDDTTITVQLRLSELIDTLGRTSDAMVAIGPDLTIVGWNDAAEDLLGYTAEEALGRPCFEVLAWSDRCGEAVCNEECAAVCQGDQDEIVATREVIGRTASGKRLWLNATTLVPPTELRSGCRLIHLVREVALPPELERLVVERLQGWSPALYPVDPRLASLTPREKEVLGLLTEGLDGAAIAERLFLSAATVRNHVQHILTKLEVHSRTEAVALALRNESQAG